jgi:hypothetical protein
MSGATYSVPLLTTTSQVSGANIAIAPRESSPSALPMPPALPISSMTASSPALSVPPALPMPSMTASSPALPMPSMTASSPALSVPSLAAPSPSAFPVTVSMPSTLPMEASPFPMTASMPSIASSFPMEASSPALSALPAPSALAVTTSMPSSFPLAPLRTDVPGPSGSTGYDDDETEQKIHDTYTLVKGLSDKIDAMLNNNTKAISGVDTTVKTTMQQVADISSKIDSITPTAYGEAQQGGRRRTRRRRA